jgi:hypothetical protein
MGCDIHAYEEYKDPETGNWVAAEADTYKKDEECGNEGVDWYGMIATYSERNYRLFGLLAGVRADIPRSFEPKLEIPEDCSNEIYQIYKQWDTDAHTPSYLTLSELKEKMAQIFLLDDQLMTAVRDDLQGFINSFSDEFKHIPDVDRRMVFFFDN